MSKLTDVFGEKPILAGVYADKPSKQMLEEIKILAEEGVSGVYLENLNGFNDRKGYERSLKRISEVLSKADLKKYNVGLNIMPHYTAGRTRTGLADSLILAKELDLPFIINDLMGGKYEIEGRYYELDNVDWYYAYSANRTYIDKSLLIGGVMPPYSRLEGSTEEEALNIASRRADALMVKAGKHEPKVPMSRVHEYMDYGRPVIMASKINERNIGEYARMADGFIIGSALRFKNGNLKKNSIRPIIDIVDGYR